MAAWWSPDNLKASVRTNVGHLYQNNGNSTKGYKVIHPCIAAATSTLERLRHMQATGPVAPGEHLVPGVYFSADLSQSDVKITLQNAEGSLLQAIIEVTGSPQWLSLNIELGEGSFAVEETVGLLVDTQAETPFSVELFIRSFREGFEHDTPFSETLHFDTASTVSTLLHQVAPGDPLANGAGYHTLVLPLPAQNSAFPLRDMRVLPSPTPAAV